MSNCPYYVPVIKAAFARVITDAEINHEFEEIERVFECVSGVLDTSLHVNNKVINLGIVTTSVVVDPADGIIQFMTLDGDVEITLSDPEVDDPLIITLILEDGGSGRFNLPTGSAWTSDSNGSAMDGKPWDSDGLGGDYGAVVTCVNDGTGWVFMVYSRNDIDFDAAVEAVDL